MITRSQGWISAEVLEDLRRQAAGWHPLETGGLLMGYFVDENVVITCATDAGPKAVHERFGFRPDANHQQRELTTQYNASGRRNSYLGDWHSHPDGEGRLSLLDRRTLIAIADHQEARVARPVMLLLAGGPEKWTPKLVRLAPKSRWRRRRTLEFELQLY